MTRRWVRLCASSAAVVLCIAAPAVAGATVKVAVLDVQTSNLEAQLAPMLTEVLTTEVTAIHGIEAISSRDILAIIGFERQKELIGCNDVSCLAELGGSLGVDRILITNVGRLGETYVVNMKLINIRSAQVEDRVYETVSKLDRVLEVIRTATGRVLERQTRAVEAEEAAARAKAEAAKAEAARAEAARTQAQAEARARDLAARKRTAAQPKSEMDAMSAELDAHQAKKPPAVARAPEPGPEVAVREGPSRGIGALEIALWGAGAAGLVTGGVLEAMARTQASHANDPTYVGGQLEAQRAAQTQRTAVICLGAGAVLAASGLALWLWPSSGPAAPTTVAFAPLAIPDGIGAVLHATF